jgi:hypothetical protein
MKEKLGKFSLFKLSKEKATWNDRFSVEPIGLP